MSLTPAPAETEKGRHYEFIKSAVSEPFKNATLDRAKALAATSVKIEPWFSALGASTQAKLRAANLKAWTSQNLVDHFMARTDLYAFAEPLLRTRIKECHGLDLDVQLTWVRLYREGKSARTVSLLDAALHNFASGEDADPDSSYISKPNENGHFDTLPIYRQMSIGQFQQLCRDLDIGAQYKTHLESLLLPADTFAQGALRAKVIASQQDALAVAAQVALLKGDLGLDAHTMLFDLIGNQTRPQLAGWPVRFRDLSLLGTRLTGVSLMLYGAGENSGKRRAIAYIPHDPDHPLKDYDSLADFKEELIRQLRDNRFSEATRQTYRQFFSQFVDQQQRGHFFAELEQRLFTVRYFPREDPTDQRPPWRKVAVEKPRLHFRHLPFRENYWRYGYQQKLNKILNDAREIAVSTADADSKARREWWDNFLKILEKIAEIVLLIATPFVPGLGEVMMVITALQLTTEVIEGVVDLAEGLGQEAAEHVISVVTNIIQLATFSAGAQIGEVFRVKLSTLVDDMLPVKLPDGKASLWHRDLAPYAHDDLTLSAESKPDRHGLHQHERGSILPLDDKLYVVEKASADPASKTHRIKHPKRTNAYQPKAEHNGQGAWLHEAENPQDWPDAKLMQRLGHSVERFTPAQRENIRRSSGTTHDELRRMHSDNSPPPPLLADTVKRFDAHEEVLDATAKIRNGEPIASESVWLEPMLTGLPGWPSARALEVFARRDLTGYSRKYGNPLAAPADTLRISLADLTAGRLPERVAGFLRDEEFNNLLGPMVTPEQRVAALRNRLADAVNQRRNEVVQHVYQAGERGGNGELRVIRQTFPELPLPLAEKVVAQARPAELQRIHDEQRLPLRLKTEARELDFEASATRAYEGFLRDDLMTAQTERLALNTLKIHTDSFADLRIEVLEASAGGPLRCSVGPENATTVRRLIRNETGRYEVRDANGHSLHDGADFYESVLRALPDNVLANLNYRRGQGSALKLWLMDNCALPAERRSALAEPPIRAVVPRETELLVRGWPWEAKTPEQRLRQLYPKLNDQEIATFIKALEKKGETDAAITRLERERKTLDATLENWRYSYPSDIDASGEQTGISAAYVREGGLHIEQRLKECFARRSEIFDEHSNHPEQGYTLDLSSEMLQPDLELWWRDLRQRPGMNRFLEQITALKLDNTQLSASPDGLLGSFPNLRQLSARRCELQEIPTNVGRMNRLEVLDLADNNIQLSFASARQLDDLARLRILNLNGNTLRVPPDVGNMDQLFELNLANTRIRDWPQGLLEANGQTVQRPRGFMLDMRGNPIDSLPQVELASDQARLVSRARFDKTRLTNEQRVQLGRYRESTGLSFDQRYSQAAQDEISHWQLFPRGSAGFSQSASYSKYREESWHDLMNEPDSAGFFSVIRKQRETADYRTEQGRRNLTARVWEMVDAAALDDRLREQLFRQAASPKDGGDLGARLFNSLGLKVLVTKACNESTSPSVLENRLVRLARGAARLDRVSDEAAMEVSRQQQQHLIDPHLPAPDETQVHRAFETGLGERLDLPWQSPGMPDQPGAGVTQAKLDAAYQRIIGREQGDGLIDGMIDLDSDRFWENYLIDTCPERFQDNHRLFEEKYTQLNALRSAQAEWAGNEIRTPRNDLQRRIERLADLLGIAHEDVLSGEAMTDAQYTKWRKKITHDRNELSRTLTREALDRAGL